MKTIYRVEVSLKVGLTNTKFVAEVEARDRSNAMHIVRSELKNAYLKVLTPESVRQQNYGGYHIFEPDPDEGDRG